MIRAQLRTVANEHAAEISPGWAAGAAANAGSGNYHAASKLAANAMACSKDDDWQQAYDAERAAQCELLRSIVTNPFRK
jgi:hypothetical protein